MKSTYYKLPADQIYEQLAYLEAPYSVQVEGLDLTIHPHVYPSEKFRTTRFALKAFQKNFPEKIVCDMGCGPGIVGLYALKSGAARVVQADINPFAVQNARENNKIYSLSEPTIATYQSDCFDQIPPQIFDMIVFNMPFHSDEVEIKDPLERAFYDPGFRSIQKFLSQIPGYAHPSTEIFIAFSDKGDTRRLESIFSRAGYQWELWEKTNTTQEYDNRIYKLSAQ